jgi:CubicO group peptidase (beta-lactamase class C family)
MSVPDVDERTARDLRHRLAESQSSWRALGVGAAVRRHGALVWSGTAGSADTAGAGLADDMQLRIGSITKTFTAVLVMQCRDEGLLDLDDRLDRFLPEESAAHGALTPRRMLAHLSGLQREPVGDIWANPEGPDRATLLAGLADAEAVLPPADRWHYSNLAYALLGEVVARLRGGTWEEVLRERLLEPLGLDRTTVRRSAAVRHRLPHRPVCRPAARGAGVPRQRVRAGRRAVVHGRGPVPVGQLPRRPRPGGPRARDARRDVHAAGHVRPGRLDAGLGLGLMLYRRDDRVLVGHGGAMPGFLAGLVVRRPEKVAAAVLVNTSAGADPDGLAIDLALAVVDDAPDLPEPWRPGPPVPAAYEDLLGVWWTEGNQFTFSVREGRLEARAAAAPAHRPPAVFEPEGEDRFRVVSGASTGRSCGSSAAPTGRCGTSCGRRTR